MAKRIGTVIIIALIMLFAWQGYSYLHYRKQNAVSDAAFIKSDQLSVVSYKVGGKVIKMLKNEHDSIKKGELLAIIDPKDLLKTKEELLHKRNALQESTQALQLKKERLERNLALKHAIAEDTVKALQAQIAAKEAQLQAARAKLQKLQKDEKRFFTLMQKRLVAKDSYQKLHTQRIATQKEIQAMQKGIEALRIQLQKSKKAAKIAANQQKMIKELAKTIAANKEQIKALDAAIAAINLKISYTKLYAPYEGVIAKKFFDAPKVVSKGSPVYAITDPTKLYCEVLLSEKKLHGVKVGNPVKIEVDALPDRTYEGVVESIAPTSASTFSLVPRDIASGEFTKLDQRFKVRIRLKNTKDLRAGMGATVAIRRSE